MALVYIRERLHDRICEKLPVLGGSDLAGDVRTFPGSFVDIFAEKGSRFQFIWP